MNRKSVEEQLVKPIKCCKLAINLCRKCEESVDLMGGCRKYFHSLSNLAMVHLFKMYINFYNDDHIPIKSYERDRVITKQCP